MNTLVDTSSVRISNEQSYARQAFSAQAHQNMSHQSVPTKTPASGNSNSFFKTAEDRPAALVSRNIVISGKRTSIRLEPSMWDALEEICVREQCNIHQICTLVSSRLSCSSFTAAVRVFVLSYYRSATTELGHAAAGHGQLRGYR
ncbi:MAG: ribbon-helix-helix domain-containing protein [Alphaproteobacteria bacterium]